MDLGCAVHSRLMRSSQVGSPAYFSPEQLGHHLYDEKTDLWSLGVIAYELLVGYSPFNE